MPRAIADSDDEDEDVVIHCGADDEVQDSGGRGLLGGAATASGSLINGTIEKSIGSTGKCLRTDGTKNYPLTKIRISKKANTERRARTGI